MTRGHILFLLIFTFLIYFLLFCEDKNYGINLMEEDLKNSDDYKECIKTKKIYKGYKTRFLLKKSVFY